MNDITSWYARKRPIAIRTQPAHTPTVPSFQTSNAPPITPPIAHAIWRCRETSSSISTGPCGSFAASSVSPRLAAELADAGLDLVEGDIAKAPCRDDVLT